MDSIIHQENVLKYLDNYPNVGILIPVYGKMPSLGTDAFFQCCLVPFELVEKEMKTDCTNEWSECSPGFTEYGMGADSEIIYHRFGNSDGFEPLVIERNFDGLGVDNEIEVCEEFRLINNLYFDHAKGEYVDLDNETTVVKIENELVTIHKGYLVRFLAAKQMSLLVHLSSLVCSDSVDPEIEQETKQVCVNGKNITISYCIEDFPAPKKIYSSIYAKIAISGCNLYDCGYWPYSEMQRMYEEFIVGVDGSGKEVTFSSNPDLLNRYGRINAKAPNYFSLVFFKRDVLRKYYEAPTKYTVGDGFVRCAYNWILYIDNQSADYVSAYLGDLGKYLPSQKEQQHWRQYNIIIDAKLSRAKWLRDFGVMFTEPDSPIFRFQMNYESINKLYEDQLGWPLFLPLTDDDAYNFTGLRVPISNAQPEFDMLILSLVKVLIDSLNDSVLSGFYDSKNLDTNGSIFKLEHLFETIGVKDYAPHISFLRSLQRLRSTGTGHRKGTDYSKAASKFSLPENDFKTAFIEIIGKAIEFLNYTHDIVDEIHQFQSDQAQTKA